MNRATTPSVAPPSWWWLEAPRGTGLMYATALAGPAWLYARVVTRRARRMQGLRLPVPVISVGNLTVGGTGKTPLVQWIANRLLGMGLRPAVLARGYGGEKNETPRLVTVDDLDDATLGDEARETAWACPGALVIVSPRRTIAAQMAIETHGANCLVLDDGFQHLALERDINIAAIDATRPFGNGRCLPAGPLREPLQALRRADLVAITRANQVEPGRYEVVRSRVRQHASCPTLPIGFRLGAIHDLHDPTLVRDPGELGGVTLVSGVGNPTAFERLVRQAGVRVVRHLAYADHASYDARTLQELSQPKFNHLLITGKDAVKLRVLLRDSPRPPVSVARLALTDEAEEALWTALEPLLLSAMAGHGMDTASMS